MAPHDTRLEMSLDEVIETEWKPKPTGPRSGAAAGSGRASGVSSGRGGKGKGRGWRAPGRAGAAPKVRNGLLGVRRTIATKARTTGYAQPAAVGWGRGQKRRPQQNWQLQRRQQPQQQPRRGGLALWRGAQALQGRYSKGKGRGNVNGKAKGAGKSNGWASGKAGGKSGKAKGRPGLMALGNGMRKGGIQKQRTAGKGLGLRLGLGRAKGLGKGKAATKGGKRGYKGYSLGKGGAAVGKGTRTMTVGGKNGGRNNTKGTWQHDMYDGPDFSDGHDEDGWSRARGASKGKGKSYERGKGKGPMRGFEEDNGGGNRPETPRNGGGGGAANNEGLNGLAQDMLTSQDRRMMKKITIVAQLDKVPKPPLAMQGLALNTKGSKRSGASGGDTGSLSSRFGANFDR